MITRCLVALTLIISTAFYCGAAVADTDTVVEVIPLQYSLPEEIIPSLQPLLEPGDGISSHNNNLVIRTTPERMQQIHALLSQLDVQMQQLLISVRSDEGSSNSGYGGSVQGSINKGKITLGNSGIRSRSTTTPGSHTTVQVNKHYSTTGGGNQQQVRTLEGRPVYISDGQLVPLVSSGGYYTPGVEYRDVARGFYATARVHGDEVTLSLSRHSDRVGNEGIKTGQIDSTVRGRVGEWLLIGGVDQNERSREDGLARRYSTTSADSSQTWIKVELD